MEIIPDRGLPGAEFAITFTFRDFERKIITRLDSTAGDYMSKLYMLMPMCFQDKALSKWNKVAGKVAAADRTAETFKAAQKDYLEEISGIKNLGNCIIRLLASQRAKPCPMSFNDYLDRRELMHSYLDTEYVRYTYARLSEQERTEQIFKQQPKAHQQAYAREHEEAETDLEKLKVFC